jgi:hypothetical protein
VEKVQKYVYSLALGIIDKGDHTKVLQHEIEKLQKYAVFHIGLSYFNYPAQDSRENQGGARRNQSTEQMVTFILP